MEIKEQDFLMQEPTQGEPAVPTPLPAPPTIQGVDPIQLGAQPAPKAGLQLMDSQPDGSRKKALKIALLVVVPLLLLGSGAWGFVQYNKYLAKTPIETLLPEQAPVVLQLTLDPDASQFALVEQHAQKFPGYETMKEKFKEEMKRRKDAGSLEESLKKDGVDYQQDVRPMLGDVGYFIITDLSAFKDEFSSNDFSLREKTKTLSDLFFQPSSTGQVASNEAASDVKVMGEQENAGDEKQEPKTLPYVFAVGIKDLGQAKKVFEKLKASKGYEITELEYDGYFYTKFIEKNSKEKDDEIVRTKETYRGILGGNVIIASSESDFKKMIDAKRQQGIFGNKEAVSLATNQDYQKVLARLSADSHELLGSLYLNLDKEQLAPGGKCPDGEMCPDRDKFFQPKNPQIIGISLAVNQEGFVVKTVSNQFAFESLQERSIGTGQAKNLPDKINDKWGDMYVEYASPKDLYYSMKKELLTDEGITSLSEAIADIEKASDINIEKDIIDLLSGNFAAVMYSHAGQPPEGAVVFDTKDPAEVVATANKLITSIKKTAMPMEEPPMDMEGMEPELQEMLKQQQEERQKERLKKQEALAQLVLTETDTEAGKLYSIAIPDLEGSLNFAFHGNTCIMAIESSTVTAILQGLNDGSGKKLMQSDSFNRALGKADPNSSAKFFINTQGLWNALTYFFMQGQAGQPEDDSTFAIGAILRTIKLIGFSSKIEDGYISSHTNIVIQELPQADKDRANNALKDFDVPFVGARDRAVVNSALMTMTSINHTSAVCVAEGSSVIAPTQKDGSGSGDIICDLPDINEEWPTLPSGATEAGYQYGTVSNTQLTMIKDGIVAIDCNVETGRCEIVE